MRQFIRFGIVGTIGFLVDASILYFLMHAFALHPLTARPFSFLTASSVTWYLNRHFTFAVSQSVRKMHEWLRYIAVTGFGAGVNLLVYSMLVINGPWLTHVPLIALAIASVTAMFFNFFASKWFAFTKTVPA